MTKKDIILDQIETIDYVRWVLELILVVAVFVETGFFTAFAVLLISIALESFSVGVRIMRLSIDTLRLLVEDKGGE